METKAKEDLTKDVFEYTSVEERDFKSHPHRDRAPQMCLPPPSHNT